MYGIVPQKCTNQCDLKLNVLISNGIYYLFKI